MMKKINKYFFDVEKISIQDFLYFYGSMGAAILLYLVTKI